MRRLILVALISALAGVGIGALAASWYWLEFNARFMTSNLVLRTQADLVTRVKVLESLRAGDSRGATNLLEVLLDGDLIAAGALVREGHQFSEHARRAVALALEARRVSGYEPSDASVRSAVEEAFILLSPRTDGGGAQPGAAAERQQPPSAPVAAR
jgi:hypothetical protein